jgi:hypothetical protein
LKKYFDIVKHEKHDDEKVKPSDDKDWNLDAVLHMIRQVKSLDLRNPLDKKTINDNFKKAKTKSDKLILQIALNAYDKEVFLLDDLFTIIEQQIINNDDWKSRLLLIADHIMFHSIITGGKVDSVKQFVSLNFGKLTKLSSVQFNEHVGLNLININKIVDTALPEVKRFLRKVSPHKFIKYMFEIKLTRNNKGGFKEIVSLNPFGVLNLKEYRELDLDYIQQGEVIYEKKIDLDLREIILSM